jgi:hypothetical protein
MQRRSITTGLCALALFATHASAQRYTLRKPAEQLDEFSMGFDVMSPCKMSISNLGYVYGNYNNTNGYYQNGYVYKDNLTSKDGKTYYFSYTSIMQLCNQYGVADLQGNYIKLTDVKAVPTDGAFSVTKGGEITPGVFIDYTRYLTKWHKLGFTIGVSNYGSRMTALRDWTADLYTRSDVYECENVSGVNGFTGGEARRRVYSPDEPNILLLYKNGVVYSDKDQYLGQATVTGGWRLNTSYVTLHLGPTYNFFVTRHFIIRVGGGLAVSEATVRYHWIEDYTAPLETGDAEVYCDNTVFKQKILFGYWGNVGAHYRVSRVMTVFSALQYQTLQNLCVYENNGQKIYMNNAGMYSVRTGFTWSF